MRISDWSSDVCSSDLQPRRAKPPAPLRIPPPRPRARTGRIDQNAISRPFKRGQRPRFMSLIHEAGFDEERSCPIGAGRQAGTTAADRVARNKPPLLVHIRRKRPSLAPPPRPKSTNLLSPLRLAHAAHTIPTLSLH